MEQLELPLKFKEDEEKDLGWDTINLTCNTTSTWSSDTSSVYFYTAPRNLEVWR